MERVEDELQEKKQNLLLPGRFSRYQARLSNYKPFFEKNSNTSSCLRLMINSMTNNKKLFWSEEDYLRLLGEDLVK